MHFHTNLHVCTEYSIWIAFDILTMVVKMLIGNCCEDNTLNNCRVLVLSVEDIARQVVVIDNLWRNSCNNNNHAKARVPSTMQTYKPGDADASNGKDLVSPV